DYYCAMWHSSAYYIF
nr:immunoglobulin light chain junction region [Macaca mulatta]MOX28481.1 immunoglobulin light chain junction region [Macaca mulatta]MOX29062.1 immunoglobulin light chain junction region [Macaca mulatta]MOX29138.1 immunoglobulin light chain junction region [Macaca mulatta]MOX29162.1 immunoglobulin light chain junction region [Macaca mulatta]